MSHLVSTLVLALSALQQSDPQPAAAPPLDDGDAASDVPELIVTGTLEADGVPIVPIGQTGSRDVLGPEAVQRIGARDLNDLVQYLPAVSTRPYNGGDASAPSFSMRGLPDDGLTEYTLVLIDGVPASPLPYGWTAFSFFPLVTDQVYAIDLVRGGQSVRYSPNNVAGALNLITRPIPPTEAYEIRTLIGSNDYTSTLVTAGDDDGSFGYLVTLGQRKGDGYRDDGGFEYGTADAKLRWSFGTDDWFALRTSYVDNEHQAPGGLTQADFAVDRFGNARPENRFDGSRFVTDFVRRVGGDRNHYEWFGWFSQTARTLKRTDPLFGQPFTNLRITDDDAFNAALGVRGAQEFEFAGLDHDLYWGVRANREWIPNRTTVTIPIPSAPATTISDIDYTLQAFSAHVDDTFEPIDDLTVVLGVRAEWIPTLEGDDAITGETEDQSMAAVLPGAGASYTFNEHLAAFANFQQSFRPPQVFGLDTTLADPAQDLSFEEGQSFEVGLRTDTTIGLSGSVALWRVDFDDVAFFGTSGLYENIGDIRSEGVDLVVAYEIGELVPALAGFSVEGSGTWQDSELVAASNPAFNGNETPYAWEEKFAWSLQYEFANSWQVALGGVFVGESFSDEANTVAENANGNLGLNESRTIWDLQIGHDFVLGTRAAGRLTFGATNLFDSEWLVHSRGGFFGGGKVAGPPRQLYLGFTLGV